MPLVSDYSDAKTFKNEGIFNYAILESTDSYSFEFDHNVQDGTIKVNDETMTVPRIGPSYANSFSVVYDEDWLFRMSYSVNQGGYYAQVVGVDTSDNAFRYSGSISASISEGVFTVEIDTDYDGTVNYTKTLAIKNMYAIVPDPEDAILKVSTESVYIKGDTELSMSGLTAIPNWYDMIHIEGSYDDGVTISSPNVATATFSNTTWNIEPVDGYIDLYKLTSIEFDITNNDSTVHATYSYFGVPSEVTADPDNPAVYKNLVSVLPLFALILLVAGAATLVYFKNKD